MLQPRMVHKSRPRGPEPVLPYGRHMLDRIARAVVTGERGLGRAADRVADVVATHMASRLAAVGVPGAVQARGSSRPTRLSRELLAVLVGRAEKHLASACLARMSRGGPHPR